MDIFFHIIARISDLRGSLIAGLLIPFNTIEE